MGRKLNKAEKKYLHARVDDMLKTFKFERYDEVAEAFDYIIECLKSYKQTCTEFASLLSAMDRQRR